MEYLKRLSKKIPYAKKKESTSVFQKTKLGVWAEPIGQSGIQYLNNYQKNWYRESSAGHEIEICIFYQCASLLSDSIF